MYVGLVCWLSLWVFVVVLIFYCNSCLEIKVVFGYYWEIGDVDVEVGDFVIVCVICSDVIGKV